MTKVIVFIICTGLYALTFAANTMTKEESASSMANTKYQDTRSYENLDMDKIMYDCNDTFRTEMSYLESLNQTGSFSDEGDKTPKCFMRCMLMNMGVMTDEGLLNPARAAVLFAGERNGKPMEDIGDLTALCADRRESCKCEKAYQFMRCLMTMEIEKYESSQ